MDITKFSEKFPIECDDHVIPSPLSLSFGTWNVFIIAKIGQNFTIWEKRDHFTLSNDKNQSIQPILNEIEGHVSRGY